LDFANHPYLCKGLKKYHYTREEYRNLNKTLPQSKNKNQKNAQIPTDIMISTKKQFHLLGEYQRQPSPSLTIQTLCIHEHYKLDTTNELLTSRIGLITCVFLVFIFGLG
jgi:hypothetical protein